MMTLKPKPLCRSDASPCTTLLPAVGLRSYVLKQLTAMASPVMLAAPTLLSGSCSLWPPAPRRSMRLLHVCAAAVKEQPIEFDVSVSVEELSLCRRKATIIVPARAVKAIYKRGVKRLERDVVGDLRGWQAGKPLPIAMVISKVGGNEKFKTYCLEELLLEALPRGIEASLQGKAVDPASIEVPSADFPLMLERYDPTKEFTFSANYDVAPPVVWATPLEKISVTIKDTGDFQTDAAAADDLIRQYRKQHGFSRVVAGRGVQMGDTLVMDMQICSAASGQSLPGLSHTRISFDTEQDVLGITDGMAGMMVGESRKFKTKMPDDYEVEFWQNMPVTATIRIHEIFEWTLPEFNDAYVAEHHGGKWRSAAEMRQALITSTAMQRLQQLDKQLEDTVVKAVADALDISEVPSRMVEQLGERQFQAQLLQMIEDRIGSREDVEKLATEEMAAEYITQRKNELVDQVKFNLAVDDIFATRGLELDEEAVEAEYRLRVQQMQAVGQPFERDELLADVRETVRSVTVIEWLKDNIRREVVPYNNGSAPYNSDSMPAEKREDKAVPAM